MIYTRFGEPVTVIDGHIKRGEAYIRHSDGTKLWVLLFDLKADNGIQEIVAEIKKAKGGEAG